MRVHSLLSVIKFNDDKYLEREKEETNRNIISIKHALKRAKRLA